MPLSPWKFLRTAATVLQTLSLYGACGIVCLGFALSRLLHFKCGGYAPLWFCAAVFIYNVDRLKADPADPVNIPLRSRVAARLRKVSLAAAILSAAMLFILPIAARNWLMAALVIAGAFFCANYSIAIFGFRFKDVPLVKTLFAPAVVAAALLGPPISPSWHGCFAYCCLT
jgi:hypothetical protein